MVKGTSRATWLRCKWGHLVKVQVGPSWLRYKEGHLVKVQVGPLG